MQFLRDHVGRSEVLGLDVLEVGSQDVNGSPREVIQPLSPRTYYGVDFCEGKGVDVVLDANDLVSRFGPASFDLVVSTEMLEHVRDWKTAIRQMKRVLKPGGFLVISTRGPGFPYHGHPHDYWRYTVRDFERIFSDLRILVCKEDVSPGVLFKAFKYPNVPETDLSGISVEAISPPEEEGPIPPLPAVPAQASVDILVANWNTLPWLRLLVSQIRRFPPKIKAKLFVWDNGSTDGSVEWLKANGIPHYLNDRIFGHGDSLRKMIAMTSAPYIAFMDADSFPIKEGWLDEAIAELDDPKVGAAGLRGGGARAGHPHFVHPAFCVFRREVCERLALDPGIVHVDVPHDDFDVGEVMCRKMEEARYELRFLGRMDLDLAHPDSWGNKVVHALSSTPVLCEKRADMPFVHMVNSVVDWHRKLLGRLGLWEEFERYAAETADRNPRCGRYVDARTVDPSTIRLSIVIPTLGRESLRETFRSILEAGAVSTDEVIVVGDGEQPRAREICQENDGPIRIRYVSARETRLFGAHQRNVGLGMATGTHALFIDDDDRYRLGALELVRKVLSKAPDRPHLFRVQAIGGRRDFGILWRDPEFRLGNVGSQMIAVPIVDGLLGTWPNSHCSDFGFLADTLPRHGMDRIIWREEVIVELR